jgi:hypothetical protein
MHVREVVQLSEASTPGTQADEAAFPAPRPLPVPSTSLGPRAVPEALTSLNVGDVFRGEAGHADEHVIRAKLPLPCLSQKTYDVAL